MRDCLRWARRGELTPRQCEKILDLGLELGECVRIAKEYGVKLASGTDYIKREQHGKNLEEAENRLKELHHGLEMDRTSCSRFLANQFRVLLTLAAYILFQELRRRAVKTTVAAAQVTTLRERLIKLAVWVERSVRRIVLHLPTAFPWLPTWRQIARAVGATS